MSEFNIDSVKRYLRNTVSADPTIVYSPNITDDATVVNVETFPQLPNVLVLDLDNGYSVRLDIDVYPRGES